VGDGVVHKHLEVRFWRVLAGHGAVRGAESTADSVTLRRLLVVKPAHARIREGKQPFLVLSEFATKRVDVARSFDALEKDVDLFGRGARKVELHVWLDNVLWRCAIIEEMRRRGRVGYAGAGW